MFHFLDWLVGIAENLSAIRRGDPLSFYHKFWLVVSLVISVLFVAGLLWALLESFVGGA